MALQSRRISTPVVGPDRVGAPDVGFDFRAALLVDDLAPHRVTDISHAVARRRELAAHAMHAFSEDDLDHAGALAKHDNLEALIACGNANTDLLGGHGTVRGVWLASVKAHDPAQRQAPGATAMSLRGARSRNAAK